MASSKHNYELGTANPDAASIRIGRLAHAQSRHAAGNYHKNRPKEYHLINNCEFVANQQSARFVTK